MKVTTQHAHYSSLTPITLKRFAILYPLFSAVLLYKLTILSTWRVPRLQPLWQVLRKGEGKKGGGASAMSPSVFA